MKLGQMRQDQPGAAESSLELRQHQCRWKSRIGNQLYEGLCDLPSPDSGVPKGDQSRGDDGCDAADRLHPRRPVKR
ncbi:hypothetical protein G6F62_015444 [Rhizopus arrhizus]|nr:hypothetical protein G6F66_015399 [Rhizopus arrhizus]KAG1306224.1 hypothetical protein G6F62_015444 [Rhizopus arrhizus]